MPDTWPSDFELIRSSTMANYVYAYYIAFDNFAYSNGLYR